MSNDLSRVRPVFVAGVSGATWDVADNLIAAGRLPTLQSLQARGASFALRSSRAPGDEHYRPQPAWATLLTGVEPVEHGITSFYHAAGDLRVEPLWAEYQRRQLRVGLYGCPVSWPPQPVAGYVVPSHLARDERTWPPALRPIKHLDRRAQELERELSGARLPAALRDAVALSRLGLSPSALARLAARAARARFVRDREVRALLLRLAKLELSSDLCIELQRRFEPHFTMFTTFCVDFASHRYWRYFDPDLFGQARARDRRLASAVPDAYEAVDRALGRLIRAVGEDAVVAVVSEHGMQAEPEPSELGRWRYLLRGSRVAAFIDLGDELRSRPVARWLAFHTTRGRGALAAASERLREITLAGTDRPLFDVYDHDDEVVAKLALRAADAAAVGSDLGALEIAYRGKTIPFAAIATRSGATRSAMHARDGLLVLAGRGIRAESFRRTAELVDFAPTVLTAAGLRVPRHLRGRVLDVFA